MNPPQWFPLRDVHAALSRNVKIVEKADVHAIKLLSFLDIGRNSCATNRMINTEKDAEVLTSVILSYCFVRKYPPGFKLNLRCSNPVCWNPYHRQSMRNDSKDYAASQRFTDLKTHFTVNGMLIL